jgi:hypothetical protein
MTALQLERKLSARCTQCGAAAGDTNLCAAHQLKANERTAASLCRTRAARRALGRCVGCSCLSHTYRCRTCRVANTGDTHAPIRDL